MTETGRMRARVGAVQMIADSTNVRGNVEKALNYCEKAESAGVNILCFPECASTGWESLWCTDKKYRHKFYAEPIPGAMVEAFEKKARETNMYIIFGAPEITKESNGLYNTAFLVGPDEGYIGKHRKISSEPVFEDGEEANVFETRYGIIGVFICSDMRSPELSRLLAIKGANMLFQPTLYFHEDGMHMRKKYCGKCTAQRARAMDNGVYLITANAGCSEYVNNSRIIGPDGQGPEPTLAGATKKEQLIFADIEFQIGQNRVNEMAARNPWRFRELGREMMQLGSWVDNG